VWALPPAAGLPPPLEWPGAKAPSHTPFTLIQESTMSSPFTSCARLLGAAGTGLALAAALPALADTSTAPAAVPVNATATPTTATPTTAEANAQIVVRDAETGKLRAPTPEEARALTSKTDGLRRSPLAPLPKAHANGARGMRLNDESASYSVMVRQPDGRLLEQCFDSREAADAAVKAASAGKTHILPTE